jgi:GR25 family glycosyltransferase involved in LPS biosynthesis
MPIPNTYSLFDSIVCISLKDNVKRQNHMINIADTLGIPLTFYLAERHPNSGRIGCFESHINVIRNMYENNVNVGLILEDDLMLSPGYSDKLLKETTDFMKNDTTWEMLQLGYAPFKYSGDIFGFLQFICAPYVEKHIVKYTGTLAHAYCISRRGMKKIIDTVTINIINTYHIDQWFCNIITNGYCTTPILFDQKWCFQSDNILTDFVGKFLNSRTLRCMSEHYSFLYYMSLLPRQRTYMLILFLIIFILVIMFVANSKRPYKK